MSPSLAGIVPKATPLALTTSARNATISVGDGRRRDMAVLSSVGPTLPRPAGARADHGKASGGFTGAPFKGRLTVVGGKGFGARIRGTGSFWLPPAKPVANGRLKLRSVKRALKRPMAAARADRGRVAP